MVLAIYVNVIIDHKKFSNLKIKIIKILNNLIKQWINLMVIMIMMIIMITIMKVNEFMQCLETTFQDAIITRFNLIRKRINK